MLDAVGGVVDAKVTAAILESSPGMDVRTAMMTGALTILLKENDDDPATVLELSAFQHMDNDAKTKILNAYSSGGLVAVARLVVLTQVTQVAGSVANTPGRRRLSQDNATALTLYHCEAVRLLSINADACPASKKIGGACAGNLVLSSALASRTCNMSKPVNASAVSCETQASPADAGQASCTANAREYSLQITNTPTVYANDAASIPSEAMDAGYANSAASLVSGLARSTAVELQSIAAGGDTLSAAYQLLASELGADFGALARLPVSVSPQDIGVASSVPGGVSKGMRSVAPLASFVAVLFSAFLAA